jgi:hypothetical protein
VPIGIAAFAFGAIFLQESAQARPGRFDLAGFLLSGFGLGLLMYGISEGPHLGWREPQVLATVVLTTVIVLVGPVHLVAGHPVANLTAYRAAFLAAAAIGLCAVACSLSIRDADAASTMPGRTGPQTTESRPAPATAA